VKMTGWKLVGHYTGQDPSLCETTDPVSIVDVTLHGKGNDRIGVDAKGQVVFRYRVNSELLKLPYQDEFVI